jgi:hypothetical protein
VHHRVVVGALALVELLELVFGVLRMLAGQARQAVAAVGVVAMAGGAGGHAGVGVAALEDEAPHPARSLSSTAWPLVGRLAK